MQFRILGPLEVLASGEPLSLGGARPRALLALLLVNAGHSVSVDRVIDELWGQRPPATAAHAVQVYVSMIRKVLRTCGDEVVLDGSAAGYRLDLDPERIDARRFERLIAKAGRLAVDDPGHAGAVFDEALALWGGQPLAEFAEYGFAAREADRLEELRAMALEGSVAARLACGETTQAIGTLSSLIADNPLRESPRRLLMLALYRSGRHAEALAVYRDACIALDEIGLQPGPELRALEAAILRHDASLAAAGVVEDTSAGKRVPQPTVEERRPAGETSPADPSPGRRPSRRVVTALFCDVTGSTALGEELDPEALHEVMNRYLRELRAVIERHGGSVDKFIGDAMMAVFGIPQLREDDALRAVRAAWEIRERLPAVAEEVGVALTFRTAVNTGMVLSGGGENLAIGDAVNVAARLEQSAAPGEILLGSETLRLVRDAVRVEELEPLPVKGKADPVRSFKLVGIDLHAARRAPPFDRPLVGRERELDLVRQAWERTVEESGCHLFTLLGLAGVGKSRLAAELLSGVGDTATALRGRCLHYGEGITFWPVVEALTPVGARADRVLERLGSGGAATPEELFWEVRRLLVALARERPVILHIDDLQWGEQMLLDLLDHIVELSRGVPILLLCTARPELLDDRPNWGGGKLNATSALLQPLGASECEVLLDQLGDGINRELKARVIAASEGNPLFLEEMAALAREQQTFAVPPTIQALLAARLDRLPAEQRELLERGAIEGEVFHLAAVRALAGDGQAGFLELALAALVRQELIRPHASTLERDDAFRFRHILIRDAAYAGLPKTLRADLHERFARWLEQRSRELSEVDEIAGWHLEQGIRYRTELGRKLDPALSQRAAEHLHAAGRRASWRGDAGAAVNLLERALALVPQASTIGATVCVDLAERLLDIGDLARMDELLSAAERDPHTADLAALTRLDWMLAAEPQNAVRAIETRLPRILERVETAADARGLAKAHMLAFELHWYAGRVAAAGGELRRVADYARDAGDGGTRSRALGWSLIALIAGPADAKTLEEAIGAMEREDLGPYLAAYLDRGRAELERLNGNLDAARRFARRAIEGVGALGKGATQGGFELVLGELELLAGSPAVALEALLRSDAILAELGERAVRSTTQALLAAAHERLGNRDAARASCELSDKLAAREDVLNYMTTHRVRARLALAEGDDNAAEGWARSAVRYACGTEFGRWTAEARLDLAGILLALERPQEARIEARAALDLYNRKCDLLGTGEASAMLDQISAAADQ